MEAGQVGLVPLTLGLRVAPAAHRLGHELVAEVPEQQIPGVAVGVWGGPEGRRYDTVINTGAESGVWLTGRGGGLGVLPPRHLTDVAPPLHAVAGFPQAVVVPCTRNTSCVDSLCRAASPAFPVSPVKIWPQSHMLAVFLGQPGP